MSKVSEIRDVLPPTPTTTSVIDSVDVADLFAAADNTLMQIYKMYAQKHYEPTSLPAPAAVPEFAWRSQQQQRRRLLANRVGKPLAAPKRKLLELSDDFDYIAHIRRISMDYPETSHPHPHTTTPPASIDDNLSRGQPSPISEVSPVTGAPAALSAAPRRLLQCTNCLTRTTPLWRKDDHGELLCNACGLFYKLHGVLRPMKSQEPGQLLVTPDLAQVLPTAKLLLLFKALAPLAAFDALGTMDTSVNPAALELPLDDDIFNLPPLEDHFWMETLWLQ